MFRALCSKLVRRAPRAARGGPAPARRRLRLERLEDRTTPSVLFVTSPADSGPGTLRNDVAQAATGDTILFSPSLYGQTINLSSFITVQRDLFIVGPGPENLTLAGGGLYYLNSHSAVLGLTMTGSTLPIENYGGDLTVADCVFAGNSVAQVILNAHGGNLTVDGCVIADNHGTAVAQQDFGTLVTVTNTVISGNTASVYSASGLVNGFGTMVVSDSIISGNLSSGGATFGAVSNLSTMVLIDSTVADNQGPTGVGGVYNGRGATLDISGCTISGNQGEYGGLYNDGTASATNSTIAFNTATELGGGIYSAGAAVLSLVNCTVAGNSAGPFGGGIFTSSSGTNLRLLNTIVANNSADAGPDISGTVVSLGHNLISNTSGAAGFVDSDLLNVDPQLGPLQDNGGPTLTMALQAGSAAINAGDSNGAPGTDQRGVARDAMPDIGAYEYQDTTVNG
jgi:hypothetical protein